MLLGLNKVDKIFTALIACAFLSGGLVQAQRAFTLEEATRYALQTRESLKNLRLDRTLAGEREREQRGNLYPQVSGTADFRDNLVRPTSILPGRLAGLPENQTYAAQFGTQYNLNLTLDATYTLYDPTRKPGLAAARLESAVGESQIERAENDVRLDVQKAYYSVLLQKLRVRLAEDNLKRSAKFVTDARAKFDEKRLVKIELDKLTLTEATRNAERTRARGEYERALLALKYQIGYSSDEAIALTDTLLLENAKLNTPDPADTVGTFGRRAELKTIRLEYERDAQTLTQRKRAYYPSVSLYGSMGTQAQRNSFNFFEWNQRWFPAIYLGARLSVPIFDGFQKDARLRQSRLTMMKHENDRRRLEKDIRYQTENAYLALKNARENLRIQENNRKQAELQLQYLADLFREGATTEKDIYDSERTLNDTQTQYLVSVYEYVVALLDWNYARATLR